MFLWSQSHNHPYFWNKGLKYFTLCVINQAADIMRRENPSLCHLAIKELLTLTLNWTWDWPQKIVTVFILPILPIEKKNPKLTGQNLPALLWSFPSRFSEMDWSPSWFPQPRIIQFSRSSESDESDESGEHNLDSSESDSELLEPTLKGVLRGLILLWVP